MRDTKMHQSPPHQMTQLIYEQLDQMGLLYDQHHLPIKVGHDVYQVYATQCHGSECRHEKYYALTGGQTIQVIKASHIL